MLDRKPLELTYDNLVIGSSLEAVLFAFYNKLKIIYTRNLQPSDVEQIDDFGLGTNKKNIWDKHVFQLAMAGYIPFENKIKNIRYVDANTVKLVSVGDLYYIIKFSNLYVFDDYEFLDIPTSYKSTSKDYRLIDNFTYNVKKISRENFQRNNKFINQIMFHEKEKKLSVVSYTKKDKIDELPEHLVKIKTESFLDIKNLELEHVDRLVIDLGQNVYDDFDNVTFVYTDAKLMYDFHRRWVKIDYMKYLRLKMKL